MPSKKGDSPLYYPMAPEAVPHLRACRQSVRAVLDEGLSPAEVEAFEIRFERHFAALFEGLQEVYGARPDFGQVLLRLTRIIAIRAAERPKALRRLDLERLSWPTWLQHESRIGYVAYVDKFANTLSGVRERLDYLDELGVSFLHLMPFLEPRAGDSDGGYAVRDFRTVNSALGTNAELTELTSDLRARNISLCSDFVLNHVADDHEWAKRARAGEARYRDFFHVFEDRTLLALLNDTHHL